MPTGKLQQPQAKAEPGAAVDMEGRAAEPWSRISWYRWTSFGAAKDPPRAELAREWEFWKVNRKLGTKF